MIPINFEYIRVVASGCGANTPSRSSGIGNLIFGPIWHASILDAELLGDAGETNGISGADIDLPSSPVT